MKISKELLSLVLDVNIISVKISKDTDLIKSYSDDILYVADVGIIVTSKLNLDTLGRLCKEWAVKQGYLIGSDLDRVTVWSISGRTIENDYEVYFEDYLEFTIKATEWVAKEKGLI